MWWFLKVSFLMVIVPAGFCNSNPNANFNASLRDYSVKEEPVNGTNVRTMQSEDRVRYTNFAPIRAPIRYKHAPDNYISGSSHGRGILHADHTAYAPDYDEGAPHYGYVPYPAHAHHEFEYDHHHVPEYHLGHHHHNKHFDPGLTAKAILLPVAGLAILGAAAALVSNPVLLQLGVISGRRRREASNPNTLVEKLLSSANYDDKKVTEVKKVTDGGGYQGNRAEPNTVTYVKNKQHAIELRRKNSRDDSRHFVPIPLKMKDRLI